MCKNKSCICQSSDLVALERAFLTIWQQTFTLREEAEIEVREKDRL